MTSEMVILNLFPLSGALQDTEHKRTVRARWPQRGITLCSSDPGADQGEVIEKGGVSIFSRKKRSFRLAC